jgi:hypothetical protein
MAALTEQERRKAVEFAYARIVEHVKVSAAFKDQRGPISCETSPSLDEAAIMKVALGLDPVVKSPDRLFGAMTEALDRAIEQGDHKPAVSMANALLARMQILGTEDSPQFRAMCVDLLKLMVRFRRVLSARSRGNYSTDEQLYTAFDQLVAGRLFGGPTEAPYTGPTIQDAWSEYHQERTAARPRPLWSLKTARGQAAMFSEFLDIVVSVR